jgi:glucan 1,3-beta-glucosidase
MSQISHQGTSPFLSDSSEYVVYRNVRDFGAKGDGSTDDSAAFNAAITRMLLTDDEGIEVKH